MTTAFDLLRSHLQTLVHDPDQWQTLIADDIVWELASYSKAQTIKAVCDRYSGTQLVFPGVLRLLSRLLRSEFPFHPNWKMSETHMVYWELFPRGSHRPCRTWGRR